MYKILVMTTLLLLGSPASAQAPGEAVWIDVRTAGEYQQDHLDGALRVPWDGIEKGVAELGLDKDTPIYLYCAVGGRAQKAKDRLDALGYTTVINAGGLAQARELAASRQD
jgi:phage shock protein E